MGVAKNCASVTEGGSPVPKFFATPILLGPDGVEKNLGMGELSAFEAAKMEEVLPELHSNIAKGVEFANNHLVDIQ